jgi:hypothetical protein
LVNTVGIAPTPREDAPRIGAPLRSKSAQRRIELD